MTEISEAAKRKACELANEFCDGSWSVDEFNNPHNPSFMGAAALRALARILQEHSDAAEAVDELLAEDCCSTSKESDKRRARLQSLILPDEPDPLADLRAVLKEMTGEMPRPDLDWGSALIDRVSKGLAQRGKALKIVEAGDE